MATYQILKSDGTFLTMIEDNTTNNTVTSINLFGQGLVDYGSALDENFVFMLENFSSIISPVNPLVGQLWFNLTTASLNYYAPAPTTADLTWFPLVNSVNPVFSGDIIITDGNGAESELTNNGILILTNPSGPEIDFEYVIGGPVIASIKLVGNSLETSSSWIFEQSAQINEALQVTGTATAELYAFTAAPNSYISYSTYADVSYMNFVFDSVGNVSFNSLGILGLSGSTAGIWFGQNGQTITPYLTNAVNVEATGGLYVNESQVYTTTNFNPSSYLPLSGGTMIGSIVSTDANALIITAGSEPAVIHRNDGSNYYILLSGGGDEPINLWTTARPFAINIETGLVSNTTGIFTTEIFIGSTGNCIYANTDGNIQISVGNANVYMADALGNFCADTSFTLGIAGDIYTNVGITSNNSGSLEIFVPNTTGNEGAGTMKAMVFSNTGISAPLNITATGFLFSNGAGIAQPVENGTGMWFISGGVLMGAFDGAGDFGVVGNITAYVDFATLSDARMKTDLELIKGVDTIKQLRGLKYKKNGKSEYGVIAQEIQKVIPEAVGEKDGYLTVTYNHIIAFLIESVKELSDRIEILEGK